MTDKTQNRNRTRTKGIETTRTQILKALLDQSPRLRAFARTITMKQRPKYMVRLALLRNEADDYHDYNDC